MYEYGANRMLLKKLEPKAGVMSLLRDKNYVINSLARTQYCALTTKEDN